MGFDGRRVDHHPFPLGFLYRLENRLPDPGLGPAAEAAGCRIPVAEAFGQVAPRNTRAHTPDDRIDKQAIIQAGATGCTRPAQGVRFDELPFAFRKFVSSHAAKIPADCPHSLDKRIRSVQKIEPFDCYTQDGIVNLERWRTQKIRPLFIGKEGYEKGDRTESSVTEWLNDTPEDACRASPRTWQTTAYTSFGLQYGFVKYDEMPWLHDDPRVIDSLRTIAFINVGKYGADTSTPWQRLDSLYQQNRIILHEQIELFQPNVIIGWSTLDFFERDEEFMSRFTQRSDKSPLDAVEYWLADNKLFILAYHPAYLRVSQQRYVDSIINAVAANQQYLSQKPPIW